MRGRNKNWGYDRIVGALANLGHAVSDQTARNVTMADAGFLSPGQYLLHDRDSKFTEALDETLKTAGVKAVKLPAQSPNVNAHAEKSVLSVKTECLSRMILFGEASLRRALSNFLAHYHVERPHQGKGNVILFPAESANTARAGPVQCRERLGGLLRFYYRRAG